MEHVAYPHLPPTRRNHGPGLPQPPQPCTYPWGLWRRQGTLYDLRVYSWRQHARLSTQRRAIWREGQHGDDRTHRTADRAGDGAPPRARHHASQSRAQERTARQHPHRTCARLRLRIGQGRRVDNAESSQSSLSLVSVTYPSP